MTSTALITGHEGFVGRHMRKALLERGYTIVGIDPKARPIDDARDLAHGLSDEHFDLVVHCAALVDGRETIDGQAALLGAYNLQLDGALFEWALQTRPRRIIYFSSSAAYPTYLQDPETLASMGGSWEHKLAEEDMRDYAAAPDATYGWVKLTGERLAIELRQAGIPVTVVRPFSGYGEDQDDRYPFPAMIGRAARREDPFDVWGDGQQVRDFIHIDDIVEGTFALIDAGMDGPVNLGTGVGASMDALATMAMAAAGYHAPIRHLDDKPHGVQYRVANTALLRRFYQPKISLQQGVERALSAHQRTA